MGRAYGIDDIHWNTIYHGNQSRQGRFVDAERLHDGVAIVSRRFEVTENRARSMNDRFRPSAVFLTLGQNEVVVRELANDCPHWLGELLGNPQTSVAEAT